MDYDAVFRTDASKEFRLPKPASEDNWKSRMNFCNNLSEAITTYGKSRLPPNFLEQIEPYYNNILDCAISERTQLSNSGCKLIALLPKILGRDMHSHLDRFLPVLLKLCASTKAVTVKVAATAVASIIEFCTYSPRLLWHVCQVFEDKPAGPKVHATTWLQTIMKEYHKSIHSDRDFEMISRALHLALEDADAGVRTNSRATYWTYAKLDPDGAQEIMEKLNKQAKTALQNDQHNPDKKATDKVRDPPRSQSALALIREEQKKKRAQEKAQLQRRVFETSTNSQDQIEIHEPRNSRPEKPKRSETAQPSVTTAEEDDKKRPSKLLDRSQSHQNVTTNHKKALSRDEEITKPTLNSRLLSAPVRRPRIVATPMNNSQTSRPSSRTGQVPQIREQKRDLPREPPQDVRPTSSSSSKATGPVSRAEKTTKAPISPKVKAALSPDGKTSNTSNIPHYHMKPSSPESKHVATDYSANSQTTIAHSPDGRGIVDRNIQQARPPKFVPEGKENDGIEIGSFSKTKDAVWNTRTAQVQTSPKKRQPPLDQNGQTSPFGPRLAKPETFPMKSEIPLRSPRVSKEMTSNEINVMASQQRPQPLHPIDKAGHASPEVSRIPRTSPRKKNTNLDIDRARDYFASLCRNLTMETLPPLGFRRLKGLLEEYNTELIQDQKTYDGLMQIVLYQIVTHEDIDGKKENPADYMINPVYNRQVLLQMITPLINHFQQWAQNWLWSILYALILYRNTLPLDGTDRRLIYCDQNINRIIEISQNPLDLIDSAIQALCTGEETYVKFSKPSMQGHRDISGGSDFAGKSSFDMPEEQQVFAGLSGLDINDSDSQYSIRSRWKHLDETRAAIHGANPEETIAIYMRRAIDEQNTADASILQKKLPFLLESGTSALTLILAKATSDGYALNEHKTDMLCRWAAHCMANYNYVIRRAIVSYCQALYGIMRDDQLFFSYFEDEGQINLLNYYLVGLRTTEG